MQPSNEKNNWQRPTSLQPAGAPHPLAPERQQASPVVTMSSEEPLRQNEIVSDPIRGDQATEEAMLDLPSDDQPVHWQAQEYIHREKNAIWFVTFGGVVAILMALAIFVMNSLTFAILIPVMAAALVVYSHRPPRLLDYTLSRQGLHINDHLYKFTEFKSFGVVHGDDEYSVRLIPVKRFQPAVSVYFPEEAGEAIVDMLGARLPMEELHLDIIDRIIRKLRL
jgi:hypothetical protein